MPTLTARGQRRRDEILRTALTVLSQRGYAAASLREIGRALGVQPAQLLHYFHSRAGLLEAVISEWDQSGAVAIKLAESRGRDFLDAWPDAVAANTSVPGLIEVYSALRAESWSPEHPSHSFFLARASALRACIEGVVHDRVVDGVLPATADGARIATRLIALADGLMVAWLYDRTTDMSSELRAAIADLGAPPARGALPVPRPAPPALIAAGGIRA